MIESHDPVFAANIAKTLEVWGCRHLRQGADRGLEPQADEGEVVLLDIRELTDDAFGAVYSIRQGLSGVEVVLINRSDNVAASIAGMKAGAADEVIVPFDTGTLKTIITDACQRARAARAKRKPLLTHFSEAMMAATFAQAGDFAGALDVLDKPKAQRDDSK